MVYTPAHRHYTHHLWYRRSHRRFHLQWRKFAEGVFLGAWLFLLGILCYTHITEAKLIDPTRVLLKHEQIEKPTPIRMGRTDVLDTKTHITAVKVETSKDLTPILPKTPAREAHTAPHNEITRLIKVYFPQDYILATAVFLAESGLNPQAKGWNCYYGSGTRRYSAACGANERSRAWSVDCGISQQNVRGLTCPAETLTVERNIRMAKDKHDARGFQPWSAYNNQSYLVHMAEAQALYE